MRKPRDSCNLSDNETGMGQSREVTMGRVEGNSVLSSHNFSVNLK